MNEQWKPAEGIEKDENVNALRQMGVIVWMFVAIGSGVMCLLAGLFLCGGG
jgi:hypothetical protein